MLQWVTKLGWMKESFAAGATKGDSERLGFRGLEIRLQGFRLKVSYNVRIPVILQNKTFYLSSWLCFFSSQGFLQDF